MSINEFTILKAPLVTERTTLLREKHNQYVFRVDPKSTKGQIREVIEKLYDVDVERVRTANFSGKLRRLAMGRPQGRRTAWKKAIVTLAKGQEISVEQEPGK